MKLTALLFYLGEKSIFYLGFVQYRTALELCIVNNQVLFNISFQLKGASLNVQLNKAYELLKIDL